MKIVLFLEAFVIVVILLFFVGIPIFKYGLIEYLGREKEINPILRRCIHWHMSKRNKHMSAEWLARVSRITEDRIPNYKWKEDVSTSNGIESFYCLDQQSDDVRDLLLPACHLTHDKMNWWRSHFSNEYMFAAENANIIQPAYKIEKSDTSVKISTGSDLDTWIYLVAKEKQPAIYALEFDYMPKIEMQETLQICFASSSLAQRFRFNLENNKTLKFDVVDYGNFTWWQNTDSWKIKLQESCSIPIDEWTHVKLFVINDIFAIYYDGILKMAVRVKDYIPKENYWYLIFWNGTKIKSPLSVELRDFKIYHPIINN